MNIWFSVRSFHYVFFSSNKLTQLVDIDNKYRNNIENKKNVMLHKFSNRSRNDYNREKHLFHTKTPESHNQQETNIFKIRKSSISLFNTRI